MEALRRLRPDGLVLDSEGALCFAGVPAKQNIFPWRHPSRSWRLGGKKPKGRHIIPSNMKILRGLPGEQRTEKEEQTTEAETQKSRASN
jgi:hypothetical protein